MTLVLLKRCFNVFCLLSVSVFFNGCAEQTATPSAADQVTAGTHTRLELRPENSGERSRLHKLDADDRKVEIEIAYLDSSKAVATYDSMERLSEYKRYWPSGKLAVHAKLTDRGRRVSWQESYSFEGVLERRVESDKSGDRQYRDFFPDGQERVNLLMHADGSGACKIWFDMKGKRELAQSQTWQKDGSFRVDYFTSMAFPDQRLQSLEFDANNGATFTYYAAGGQVILASTWKYVGNGEKKNPAQTSNGWLLVAGRSKINNVEKLYTYSDRSSPQDRYAQEVQLIDGDGSKRVARAKKDELTQLEEMEYYDAQGKLVKRQTEFMDAEHLVLVCEDVRMLAPPNFRAADHLKVLHNIFQVERSLKSLAPDISF